MTRLTAPNGSTVNVSEKQVENLLARGFTKADKKSTRKATQKATSEPAGSGIKPAEKQD